MYGFHKGIIFSARYFEGFHSSKSVSDVFHNGAPESTLWEFKHGNGNFKRGDLNGLREIKRRASRHALIHRDSFSAPHKPSVSQPGTPAETMPDSGDPKLAHLESSIYDLYGRLARSEETNSALSTKCAVLTDNLVRLHQVGQAKPLISYGIILMDGSGIKKCVRLSWLQSQARTVQFTMIVSC